MSDHDQQIPSLQLHRAIRATAHALLELTEEAAMTARDFETIRMDDLPSYHRQLGRLQEVLRILNLGVTELHNNLEDEEPLGRYQRKVYDLCKLETAYALAARTGGMT